MSTVEYLEAVKRLKYRQMDRAVAFSSILLGFEQVASGRRQTKVREGNDKFIGDPKNGAASPA